MNQPFVIRNMPGRTVHSGTVHVKNGGGKTKKRFLKATCGGKEDEPAKLEIYEDSKSAAKGKAKIIGELIFPEVKKIVNSSNEVKDKDKKIISIELHQSEGITFYADSDSDHKKWVKYCGLLSTIPNYSIPEEPKYELVPAEFIDRYCDPGRFEAVSVWVVYIINEDVGHNIGMEGLHIIAIRRNSTLNIHNFHSGKHLLAWDRDKLRRSGCIGSLVFVEAGRRCNGGPGLLWMYCPILLASQFRECLHNFLFYGPEDSSNPNSGVVTAPTRTSSISNSGPSYDSGLNSISPNINITGSRLSASSQRTNGTNGDSGIGSSPPPVNLKTHPSIRRRSRENSGPTTSGSATQLQRSISYDPSEVSRSSLASASSQMMDDDLQFSCGRETPNSEYSDPSSDPMAMRPRTKQISNPKETYEYMRHPSRQNSHSESSADYIQMSPSDLSKSCPENMRRSPTHRRSPPQQQCNYENHIIPADLAAPTDIYENVGLNALKKPMIPPKGIPPDSVALAPIREGIREGQPMQSYENHSLSPPKSPEGATPFTYENSPIVTPKITQHLENYQNVTMPAVAANISPRSGSNREEVVLKSERKYSVRDRSRSLQYSEIENGGVDVPPPEVVRKHYSEVDYKATLAVETQQKERHATRSNTLH